LKKEEQRVWFGSRGERGRRLFSGGGEGNGGSEKRKTGVVCFCASVEKGKDACRGDRKKDGGGPL